MYWASATARQEPMQKGTRSTMEVEANLGGNT